MSLPRGFTLLECLVALAIIAVALTAALHSSAHSAHSAFALREHVLAQWVAQNQLAQIRATESWPPIGISEGATEQAGQHFRWVQAVEPTPNPLFRRIEIRVFAVASGQPVTHLSGFAVRPLR